MRARRRVPCNSLFRHRKTGRPAAKSLSRIEKPSGGGAEGENSPAAGYFREFRSVAAQAADREAGAALGLGAGLSARRLGPAGQIGATRIPTPQVAWPFP